jgi:non-canonical purine NTP pyrophosphatase (RdgB/HAM1 family)
MNKITFVTGNAKKAEYLTKFLGIPVDHVKLDLDEIQSLDLKEIVEHKVKQAYEKIKSPVIVEDVALTFNSLGKLPGPFIKFFLQEMSEQDICNLVNGKDRSARASCVFGYFDGENLKLFEGGLNGQVVESPRGENGYGWDRIFIPEGYSQTRAELSPEEDEKTYLQIKPFKQLKEFLESIK